MATQSVYVSSATGTQGGAVSRQLRALGWEVHATTRDPESTAARDLSSIGVQLTRGDWDDEAALRASISGCQKVFLNLYPNLLDPSCELKQAKAILAIAKAAGVAQIVYSSVFPTRPGIGDNEMVAQVRAGKTAIEQATLQAGFDSATVLQPGFFMANFLSPRLAYFGGDGSTGLFTVALQPDTQLPLTDQEDIARFVLAIFQEPLAFNGRTVRLASELVTFQTVVKLLEEASGRVIRVHYLSDEETEARISEDPRLGSQIAARSMAQIVDMDEVRSWGIRLGTFEEFLNREREAVAVTYGSQA
jgi:uncharacterized protein YbjT (DUF2867 family)